MENKEISEELKKRIEDFHAELVELVKKYKIDLIAGLKYTEQGILPVIQVRESKEEQKEKKEEKPAEHLTK
jgi:hypothetical protein